MNIVSFGGGTKQIKNTRIDTRFTNGAGIVPNVCA